MSITKKIVLASSLFIQDYYKTGKKVCEKALGLYVRYGDIELARDRLMCLLDIETPCSPGWIL